MAPPAEREPERAGPDTRPRERYLPLILPLGDLAVFALFLLAGASNHNDGLSAATAGRIFLPLVAVWFVVGTPLGVFHPPLSERLDVQWRLLLIWPACGLLALGLRSVLFDREFMSAFTVVALVFNGVLLVVWRLVYVLTLRALDDR